VGEGEGEAGDSIAGDSVGEAAGDSIAGDPVGEAAGDSIGEGEAGDSIAGEAGDSAGEGVVSPPPPQAATPMDTPAKRASNIKFFIRWYSPHKSKTKAVAIYFYQD
jgi:hypothetical protein